MSLRGQRFELDLDADQFTPRPLTSPSGESTPALGLIGEIKERSLVAPPTAPKPRDSPTGFPVHKKRPNVSAFRQQRTGKTEITSRPEASSSPTGSPDAPLHNPPSDRAIAHHIGKKYGYDVDSKEKQEISEENKKIIAQMSYEDIEGARAEVLSSLSPAFIDKLLKRANVDVEAKDPTRSSKPDPEVEASSDVEIPESKRKESLSLDPGPAIPPQPPHPPLSQADHHLVPPIHFPQPPIDPSTFTALDPSSPTFHEALKTHYFPSTPHDPSTLTWLTDPTAEENHESPYNPSKDNYQISQLRFSFTGVLIPPSESLDISADRGLHHHGLAPSSAGYTIPELAILARSAMPTQRCIAFQVLGRTMYRLGKGQFGMKGGELYEGLWGVIEKERVVEVLMAEANRSGGHASAKAYAVEALWLWRKGSGGERGMLKEGGRRAT